VLEHSVNGTPGKSILRTKKVLMVAKKKKKKAVMPLSVDDDDDDDEGEDDAAIVATEENTIIDEPTFKGNCREAVSLTSCKKRDRVNNQLQSRTYLRGLIRFCVKFGCGSHMIVNCDFS